MSLKQFRYMEKLFVPSNEHAAEIIGSKGQKIKRIALETQTYIQCPSPNDLPIFEIYGNIKSCVLFAKKSIRKCADHFDAMKSKKRQIILNPGDRIETVYFNKIDVPCIIGRKGKQIKKIMSHSQTKVISPDTNKSPIFIVFGKDVETCIFWMKLSVFCASKRSYFSPKEIQHVFDLLHRNVPHDWMMKTQIIVNFNILRENLIFLKIEEKVNVILQEKGSNSFYYCWNCKVNTFKIARAQCGHTISCDKCIASLYSNIYLKCFYCGLKIENFMVENFYE